MRWGLLFCSTNLAIHAVWRAMQQCWRVSTWPAIICMPASSPETRSSVLAFVVYRKAAQIHTVPVTRSVRLRSCIQYTQATERNGDAWGWTNHAHFLQNLRDRSYQANGWKRARSAVFTRNAMSAYNVVPLRVLLDTVVIAFYPLLDANADCRSTSSHGAPSSIPSVVLFELYTVHA